jgi:hypothetical protein
MNKALVTLAAAALTLAGFNANARLVEVVQVMDVPQERYRELSELADFWSVDRREGSVVMAVTPEQRRAIEALGFATRIDPQRMASLERARDVDAAAWQRAGMDGIPGFACYRTVDETKADLSALAAARPDLASWSSIGPTWRTTNGEPGGDEIYVLELANQNSPHDQAPFVLMAAQHARELATAELASRFAEWLVNNYDTDPTARWLLDHREIHIVAQQNPDGRREAEAGPILWRKNSNLDACPAGSWTGVDLNRNSDYFWGDFSDTDTCGQTYRGTGAGSEPETQAIQDYLRQVFADQWPVGGGPVPADAEGLFISVHSYSQLVLFPWEGAGSGATNNAPNHDQLAWLGRKFGFHTGYQVGRDILYSSGGTTTDFAYGELGVAAFTYEIGTDFFQDCSFFEQAMEEKLIDSLIYAAKAARRPYQAPSGPDIVDARAVWNAQSGTLQIAGQADDGRFDRGGVSEAPTEDPVSAPVEVLASLAGPPYLGTDLMTIPLAGAASSEPFDQTVTPGSAVNLPQLLYLQGRDTEGNTGVTDAVWVVEQRAELTPARYDLQLPQDSTTTRTLTIENIGSAALDWSLLAETTEAGRGALDPGLSETLTIDDFSLGGGATHSTSAPGGVATRGNVIGFSFAGDVTGLDGNSTWASDMAMTITAPGGTAYSVGGYETNNPTWDFNGQQSNEDGRYESEHLTEEPFGADGVADEGSWQFDFQHTYQDTMNWSNVSITLHKQTPPRCVDPDGVGWITTGNAAGQVAAGEQAAVSIEFDSAGLAPGTYEAALCFSSNDPAGALRIVDVTLEVTGVDGRVYEDRFEAMLP